MSMLFHDDSEFEAAALQRAVDADRDADLEPGAPPRLAVRLVLIGMLAAGLCALASVALWGTWR
jgi:hypothetical protein